MANIYFGGGTDVSSGSSGTVQVLALGALALGALYLLPKLLAGLSSTGAGTGSADADGSYASGSGMTATGGGLTSDLQRVLNAIAGKAQATAAANTSFGGDINTPGVYINEGVSQTPETGSGEGDLFVMTGEGSPTNLYPLGDVIDTSTNLTAPEQTETLTNLCRENIPTSWWEEAGLCNVA